MTCVHSHTLALRFCRCCCSASFLCAAPLSSYSGTADRAALVRCCHIDSFSDPRQLGLIAPHFAAPAAGVLVHSAAAALPPSAPRRCLPTAALAGRAPCHARHCLRYCSPESAPTARVRSDIPVSFALWRAFPPPAGVGLIGCGFQRSCAVARLHRLQRLRQSCLVGSLLGGCESFSACLGVAWLAPCSAAAKPSPPASASPG